MRRVAISVVISFCLAAITLFLLGKPTRVYAAGLTDCCSTTYCQDKFCEGNPNCTADCKDQGSPCPPEGAPPNVIGGYGTCVWTTGNTCTKWCPFGPCKDGWKTRYCCDGVNINDLEVWKCDAAVKPTCDRPDRFKDPGIACFDKEDQLLRGLYGRYFEVAAGSSYSAGGEYECGPRAVPPFDSCGWWDATWDGYFIAPTTGEYQFWLQGQPRVSMQLDVNGNNEFDQTCSDISSGSNAKKFGDRFYYLSNDCGNMKYRPKPIRRERSSGYIDPNPECPDEGCRCRVGGVTCEGGAHCEDIDLNTGTDPFKDELFNYLNYPTPGSQRGSSECPVDWAWQQAPDPGREGTANIWFKRTLSAGAHKISIKYVYNWGSSPDATSHALKLLYRKPGTENWINLSSLDDKSSCPFVPRIDCVSPPSCTVDLWPNSASISLGSSASFIASVVPFNGTVSQVNFSSQNTGVATVNPASDTTVAYQTTATGVGVGSTTIKADVIMSGSSRCDDTSTIAVTPPGAWFQTVGGSLHANGGSVSSLIPASCSGSCLPYLILEDANAETGAVSYTGSVSLGAYPLDNVSENARDWRLNTVYQGVTTGYDYFYRLLSEDPSGLKEWNGSLPTTNGVYLGDGITETSAGNWNVPSGRKIVILAPNDLVIKNTVINVASGASGGFLAIISSGNITMADNVTRIEGVYLADGTINSCQSASCSQQLNGEGIFVGWAGIDLRRDLGAGNGSAPAELFTYRPDLVVNAYRYLLRPHYSWREVAP